METPIYLITGFLEGGKTSFINYTLAQEYFNDGSKTLIILCEEGMEEYDEALLKEGNAQMVTIETEAELTTEKLEELKKVYQPERVVIEYNGMWRLKSILELRLPKGWMIHQTITNIDASTFEVYLANMKSLIMDMVSNTEMVIFNRCTSNTRFAAFRRSVKAVNRGIEVIFEAADGEVEEIEEDLPYDLEKKRIVLNDDDFGIWYMDALENPDRYEGKTVDFKAMVLKPEDLPADEFVPGRLAMTCCADDIVFIGFLCKGEGAKKLKTRQWVTVTARVKVEEREEYQGRGPVLYAERIGGANPAEEELIYFN